MTGTAKAAEPRIVVCAGMYSSGSTWLFNALRGIGKASLGADAVASCFADQLEQLPQPDPRIRLLVVKCHRPSTGHLWLTRTGGGAFLSTVRDPRDAVASLMQRFGQSFDEALAQVTESAQRLAELAPCIGEPLRYESGFPSDPATIPALAARIGLPLSSETAAELSAELAPDAVRTRLAGWSAEGRFGDRKPDRAVDPETHWHPGHVGDLRMGKFAQVLDEAQALEVLYANLRPIRIFGCAALPPHRAVPTQFLMVRPGEAGQHLHGAGFGLVLETGAFTTETEAVAWLPVGPVNEAGARINLDISVVRPSEGKTNPLRWQLRSGDTLLAAGTAAEGPPWRRLELVLPAALVGPTGVVRLDIILEDVRSVREISSVDSDRRLGLCLHAFRRIA